jgi:hypothetical protein
MSKNIYIFHFIKKKIIIREFILIPDENGNGKGVLFTNEALTLREAEIHNGDVLRLERGLANKLVTRVWPFALYVPSICYLNNSPLKRCKK